MQTTKIKVTPRADLGARSAKKLRAEGNIPCVMYGDKDNSHFYTTKNDIKSLIYTPEFKLAEIDLDGSSFKCIVKDIQWHPLTDEIVHIDFQQLVPKRKLKVEIPVRFVGVSPGVKNGGKLIQKMRKIKLKVTPEQLVDKVEFDISELMLNDSVRVRDAQVNDDVEIVNPLATPVASVEVPRALKSAEAAAEAEGEGAGEGAAAEGGEEAPAAEA